jgi:ABC-type transport system involved in Fe-S cluster assembly fused permease/ATPase subunit
MQSKKNIEKQAEFYLNESTLNYESVKTFNNEDYESKRYNGLLDGLES